MTDAPIKILRDALRRISELDAEQDSEHGWNEWGEADCFNQAKEIANTALAKTAHLYR